MLTLDEALARLLAVVQAPSPDAAETVSTFDALGRVLAADIRAGFDVPPQDNAEMDGYALRAAGSSNGLLMKSFAPNCSARNLCCGWAVITITGK